MDTAYVFAELFMDFGKWSYVFNGLVKYGESKGTTKDQMFLMAILQLLRSDEIGEELVIYIPDERTYKRLNGEYDVKSGIINDYMNEIGWAIGQKNVSYRYIQETLLVKEPFYVEVQRLFRGRYGMYFDFNGKDSIPFSVVDPFNNNLLEGYLCRIADLRYGMLYIEFVNKEYCPQWIWATPKMHYPFDKNGRYSVYDVDSFEVYEKLDGTNVLAYIYRDINDNRYVAYKTRQTPIIQNMKYGDFGDLWNEILKRHPRIPEFVLNNDVNASFELYGIRNHIWIKYDVPLEAKILFYRDTIGRIIPPNRLPYEAYGLKAVDLWKSINNDNFIEDYKKSIEELNEKLIVTVVPEGNDILEGWEGAVWYAIKDGEAIQLKAKPDVVRDLHFAAGEGIPKHSIYITCMNSYEDMDEPTMDYVIELLKEEFDDELIYKKLGTIERIFNDVYEQRLFRSKLIEEYRKHPDFDINVDRRKVMVHFSKLYDKKLISRVFTVLWSEFGE